MESVITDNKAAQNKRPIYFLMLVINVGQAATRLEVSASN